MNSYGMITWIYFTIAFCTPHHQTICIEGDTALQKRMHGLYEYEGYDPIINTSYYYNSHNDLYLFPLKNASEDSIWWVLSYHYTSFDFIARSIASPNTWNVEDTLYKWQIWNNEAWVKGTIFALDCTSVCVTGNYRSWLNGEYKWQYFNTTRNTSIYYCHECALSRYRDSQYLFGWIYDTQSHNWRIGPDPHDSSAWSGCSLGTILHSHFQIGIDRTICNGKWKSLNGRQWMNNPTMNVTFTPCPIPTTPSPTSFHCCSHYICGLKNGSSCTQSVMISECESLCEHYDMIVTNYGSAFKHCGISHNAGITKYECFSGKRFKVDNRSNLSVGCGGGCNGFTFTITDDSTVIHVCNGKYYNGKHITSCNRGLYFVQNSKLTITCNFYDSCQDIIIASYKSKVDVECNTHTCDNMKRFEFCKDDETGEIYLCIVPQEINNLFEFTWFNCIAWIALLIGIGSAICAYFCKCIICVRNKIAKSNKGIHQKSHTKISNVSKEEPKLSDGETIELTEMMDNDDSTSDTADYDYRHKDKKVAYECSFNDGFCAPVILVMDCLCFILVSIFEIYCFVKLGESINELGENNIVGRCLYPAKFNASALNAKLLSLAGLEWTVMFIFCFITVHFVKDWEILQSKKGYFISCKAMIECLFFIIGLWLYYGFWKQVFSDPLSIEWNEYVVGTSEESWCYQNAETPLWYIIKYTSDTIDMYLQNIYLFGTGIQLAVDILIVIVAC
eukprot:18339_1